MQSIFPDYSLRHPVGHVDSYSKVGSVGPGGAYPTAVLPHALVGTYPVQSAPPGAGAPFLPLFRAPYPGLPCQAGAIPPSCSSLTLPTVLEAYHGAPSAAGPSVTARENRRFTPYSSELVSTKAMSPEERFALTRGKHKRPAGGDMQQPMVSSSVETESKGMGQSTSVERVSATTSEPENISLLKHYREELTIAEQLTVASALSDGKRFFNFVSTVLGQFKKGRSRQLAPYRDQCDATVIAYGKEPTSANYDAAEQANSRYCNVIQTKLVTRICSILRQPRLFGYDPKLLEGYLALVHKAGAFPLKPDE